MAICADFTQPFGLPDGLDSAHGRRLGFFPGSTIGNFTPPEAEAFLVRARGQLGPRGALVVGVDLKKDVARLNAAYNDAQGVTAAFNLNVLHRVRAELGAELDPADFEHHAFYNEVEGRIEMHLRARRDTRIRLDGHRFVFARGETLHTEYSHKYSVAEFAALAARAGFSSEAVWTDPEQLFSMHYLVPT